MSSKKILIHGYDDHFEWGGEIKNQIELIESAFSFIYLVPLAEFQESLMNAEPYEKIGQDRRRRKKDKIKKRLSQK